MLHVQRGSGTARRRRLAALLVLLLGAFPGAAPAGPLGENVVEGSASFDRSTPGLTVVETPDANVIIDYQSFDILSGETVQFVQPDAASRVLNQISSAAPTSIDGALLANGQVYIVNPAGVVFGANAVVDVAQLFAAAGRMDHADFLQQVDRFTELSGAVANAGDLHADAIHLIGRMVENRGSISAPDGAVVMAAGETVLIGRPSSGVYVALAAGAAGPASQPAVANSGSIDAGPDGSVSLVASDLYALAFQQTPEGSVRAGDIHIEGGDGGLVEVSGTLDASDLRDGAVGGSIRVLGDKVALVGGAMLGASGNTGAGSIHVGGSLQGKGPLRNASRTLVAPGVRIAADAVADGNGGEVIVWADGDTRFHGSVSARGGERSGDGGFVEVSGKEMLGFYGHVNALAPNGKAGTLLLDPKNITVDDAGAAALTDVDAFGDGGGANDASINAATINNAGANVVLQANNDITVANTGAINMANAGVGLTMQAGRSILLNADVTTNSGAISLTANETTANGVQDANRDPGNAVIAMADGVTLNAGTADIDITLSTGQGLTNSDSGDITLENLTTTGDVLVVNNGPTANSGIRIEGTGNDGLITAASASFDVNGAGGGVGASGAPLRLSVTNAEARGDSGGIFLNSQGANLTLGGSANDLGGTTTSNGGQVEVIADVGNLNVSEPVSADGSGTVLLETNAAAADVTVQSTGAVDSGSGLITLRSNRNITQQAGGTVGAATTGDIVIFADEDGNGSGGQSTSAGSTIGNNAAGDVTITADTVAVGAAVAAGGTLTIQPSLVNENVVVGAGGAFSLTTAEVDFLEAASITIGRGDGTGVLTVNAHAFDDPMTFRMPGAGGRITTVGAVTSEAANASLTFAAGTGDTGAFTQTDGAANTIRAGSGALTIAADAIVLNTVADTISTTGPVSMQPASADRSIVLGAAGAATDFALDAPEVAAIADGAASITIGRADGTGGATINAVTFNDPVTIRSPDGGTISVVGDLTGTGDASIELDGSGATTTLTADITTAGQDILISDSVLVGVDSTGDPPVTLSTGASQGGNISITGTTNSVAGQTNPFGLISGSGTTTFSGAVGDQDPLSTLTLQADDPGATGGVTFNGSVTADTLVSFGRPYDVDFNAGGAISGDTNFLNTGRLTLSGNITFAGGLATAGNPTNPATTNVSGTVATTNTRMDLGPVDLIGGATFSSGLGDAVFNSPVNGGHDVVLNIGGTTTFNQGVGVTTPIGDGNGHAITINSAGETFFESTLATAAGITQNQNAGAVTFRDNVNVGASATATSLNADVTLDGLTFTSVPTVTFGNVGTDQVTLSGGTVTVSGQNVVFNSAINGPQRLVVNTGGTTRFTGNVGTLAPLLGLTTDAGGTTFPETGAIIVAGDVFFGDLVRFALGVGPQTLGVTTTNGGALTFGNDVFGAWNLILNSAGPTRFVGAVGNPIGVGRGVGSAITINSQGTTTFESTVNANRGMSQADGAGTVTFRGDVRLRAVAGQPVPTTLFGDVALEGVTITADDPVTFGNDAADLVTLSQGAVTVTTSNDTVTFNAQVDGAQALAVNAGTATTQFNATVGGTTPLTSVTTDAGGRTEIGASITTAGGTQTYNDPVDLTAAATLTDTGGTGLTFNDTLDGAQDLTLNVASATAFNGAVGSTTPLGDGVGAALTIDSVGTTTFGSTLATASGISQADGAGAVTFRGDVVLGDGDTDTEFRGNATLDGLVFTAQDNVTFGSAAGDQVTLSSGGVSVITSDADVTFEAQVDGAQDLVVNGGAGTTRFKAPVGGATPLTSLTTDAGGRTEIGAAITTVGGTQTYNDSVDLTGPVTLTDLGGTGIAFNNTVDGAQDLILNVSALTLFNAPVGGISPLLSLTTDLPGRTLIGASITTLGGTQTYNDPVDVIGPVTLTDLGATGITFNNTVDGPADLILNVSALTRFNAPVGGFGPLLSLTTDLPGRTLIGASITTLGGTQTYNDPVDLIGPVTLTDLGGTGLTFNNTVDGAQDLTLNVAAATSFNGAVGGTTPLGDGTGAALTIDSAGTTTFGSTLETASGISQADGAGDVTFRGDVTLGDGDTDTTLGGNVTLDGLTWTSNDAVTFGSSGADQVTLSGGAVTVATTDDDVTFEAEVDGAQALVVDAGSAATRFNAPVGGTTPLSSVTTEAGGRTEIGASITTAGGTQTYNDPVDLTGPATLTDTGGTGVTFNSTLDGAQDLTLNVAAATSFNGAVGGTTPLGDGVGAALTINSPGTTTFASTLATASGISQADAAGEVTFRSDVTLGAGDTDTTLRGNVTLDGLTFTAEDAVTFGNAAADQVTLSGGAVTVATSDDDVTFDAEVDGAQALVVDAGSATTRFNAPVGGTTPLSSLTTGAGGRTEIGASIATAGGTQTYNDPVDLTGAVTLTDTGGTGITFNHTLDGAQDLMLNVTGATAFNGAVGGTTPLGDGMGAALTINSAGTTVFGSTLATASGISQADGAGEVTFRGDVTLGDGDTETDLRADVTLDGLTFTAHDAVSFGSTATDQVTLSSGSVTVATSNDEVTFAARVDGAQALAVNAGSATTRFNATVGGATPLLSLTTDAGGRTEIGASITTAGATQTYNDPVDLTGSATLTDTGGSGVVFNNTVDGARDLILNVTGPTSFNAAVGATTAIGAGAGPALTINSAGTTTFGSTLVTASGISQAEGAGVVTFRDDVVLGAGATPTTLFADVVLDGLTFTANGGATFGNAATDQVTLSGGPVALATSDDPLSFAARVDGGQDLSVNSGLATTSFNAAVGSATRLGDGTGAALTLSSAGPTFFASTLATASGIAQANGAGTVTFRENVTLGAGDTATTLLGNTALDGLTFTSDGAVSFGDAVTDQLLLSGGPVTVATSNDAVTFAGRVDGAQVLTVNAGTATTRFGADVGGVTPLLSVTTDAGGQTQIGASITTSGGTQTYNDAVALTAASVLTDTGGTGVTFNGTLDGARDLLLNVSGATFFNGAVGATAPLGDGTGPALTINSRGPTTFASTLATASGIAQPTGAGLVTFRDNVTLGAGDTPTTLFGNVTLDGLTFTANRNVSFGNAATDQVTLSGGPVRIATSDDDLTFTARVDGGQDLVLNAGAGTTAFIGAVGSVTPLGDGTGPAVAIDSAGPTTFSNALATASGIAQANGAGPVTFRENVTVGEGDTPTTLLGDVVLDGLTFTANDDVTFGNAAADQVTISGGAVTIATSDDDVTFEAQVDGAQDLTVNAGTGVTRFNAELGGGVPLSSVTTDSGGWTEIGASISTAGGTQTYNDPVVLIGPATLTDTGGTGVTFNDTLDGPHNLTLDVAALTTFVGAVGATAPVGSGSGASITINSPGTTTFESTLDTANGVEVGPGAGPVNLPDDGGSPGPGPGPDPEPAQEADPNPVLPEITDDETARGTEQQPAQPGAAAARSQSWRVRADDLLAFLDCATLEGDSGAPASCPPGYQNLAALPQRGALPGVAARVEDSADARDDAVVRLVPPIGDPSRPPSAAQLDALRIYRKLAREDAVGAIRDAVAAYVRETGAEDVRGPELRRWLDRSDRFVRASGYLDDVRELLDRLGRSGMRPQDTERASVRILERIAPDNLGASGLRGASGS